MSNWHCAIWYIKERRIVSSEHQTFLSCYEKGIAKILTLIEREEPSSVTPLKPTSTNWSLFCYKIKRLICQLFIIVYKCNTQMKRPPPMETKLGRSNGSNTGLLCKAARVPNWVHTPKKQNLWVTPVSIDLIVLLVPQSKCQSQRSPIVANHWTPAGYRSPWSPGHMSEMSHCGTHRPSTMHRFSVNDWLPFSQGIRSEIIHMAEEYVYHKDNIGAICVCVSWFLLFLVKFQQ